MVEGEVKVRAATADDKQQIEEVSEHSWEGSDYVPRVLDSWLQNKDGELSVAELDGKIVGFSRLSVLCSGYGWLEGARVHPQWRRRGVAVALAKHHIERGREMGLKQLAMATGSKNVASQGVVLRLGFELAGSYSIYRAEPRQGQPPRVEPVKELPQGSGLIAAGWTFWPWNRELLEKWQRQGKMLGYGDAGMVLHRGYRSSRVHVSMLWGPESDVAVLLDYARCQPTEEVERISHMSADDKYKQQLLDAGFELRENKAVVYSLDLTG